MEITTDREARMYDTTTIDQAQREWDSESRDSGYSTVSNPYDDTDYCEACDSAVTYKDSTDTHGTCKCDL